MKRDICSPPTATYRLQLQPAFPFAAAERAVPHLAALGVSHLHLSPVLEAVPGSTHGYDVVDHTAVRAELGGEEGLRALSRTARAHGLGLVLDIVPNHMAVPAPEHLNGPLWQMLRDGPASPCARWFDVDWSEHGGKVLLPVLAGRLGAELARFRTGEGPGGEAVLHYGDHVLPVRPGTERLPLPELLDAQWYRPAWWRLARTELNYRRFFTIAELIAVRVEDPEVFAATHAKVLQLLREDVVDGLRVDHPDGLADPPGYLRRLHEATGGRWTVVEKILSGDERLPAAWPVAGTTGYDALRDLDGLFTDPHGAAALTAAYRAFTGAPADRGGDWPATLRRAAYRVVTHELATEVGRLVRTATRLCEAAHPLRDHAPWALRTALCEILVRLPVYRPYAAPGRPVAPSDAALLDEAAQGARTAFAVPEEAEVVELVRDAALGRLGDGPDQRDFCARFAQTASALRAKSVEDTAFYRYAPLLSATEVGAVPDRPALAPADFHAHCARRQRHWPAGGTVLSTHDTKRSADARARIAALSEYPGRWAELMDRLWAEVPAPDPHVAWVAWQNAVGLGARDGGRLAPAVLKSVREAALLTTWTEQDTAYEAAVEAFVAAGPAGPAHEALTALARETEPTVRAHVLGAALLHLTMPGVPDVYMGTESVYAALVDPDNRQPPRFPPGDGEGPGEGLDGQKLRLTRTALRLRRAHPQWFGAGGAYEPVVVDGPAAEHCVAFARAGEVVTAVTRLPRRLAEAGGWRGAVLPLPGGGPWRELLTDRPYEGCAPLDRLLGPWPVALLIRAREAGQGTP
ncbi:malto-oligosyltrehalose synthase [Streptomyces cinnamoneus]|uniref:Malto-oligosyltrehalose synthase n=1 Tax=Streptomyces cinnamoneus TaxID=53446 RepID=A0A918TY28_STRCJ|nr:malto-oligosyltrehalose synthase [Streptomyces cinnamoneus]GHC68414.1 malto-oligosyltrehalose synthase [Streptomyces cinnamoneus]